MNRARTIKRKIRRTGGKLLPFWKHHTPVFDALLLLVAAVAALIVANTALGVPLESFWTRSVQFGRGLLHSDISVERFINDLLMALFFLVVGIEVKEEIIDGDLSNIRLAALPLIAALGGMVVPILLYLATTHLLAAGSVPLKGWGIPMATDIVFATLILDLAGQRVPQSLKVFLTALAVADDLGAMVVILFIGGHDIRLIWLGVALLLTAALIVCNRLRVKRLAPYLVLGAGLLAGCYLAGVHPTIAGVIVAFALPADLHCRRSYIERLLSVHEKGKPDTATDEPRFSPTLATAPAKVVSGSPLRRAGGFFAPVASYIILPLFAFVNAGVIVRGGSVADMLHSPVVPAIALGLMVGKPLGVWLFSRIALLLRVAHLPQGLDGRQLFAAALLAGIGFTMALFIAHLSLGAGPALEAAKLTIMAASVAMGLIGYLYIRRLS
ncbi:MAG: Na+/H+ antiporter NhaA [Actinomycetes bacterium]|jgi:NhaA family Na+:H+ antiporter|nr:Na+/H+ antiporter NhaA [Actinomycetes bacterium]